MYFAYLAILLCACIFAIDIREWVFKMEINSFVCKLNASLRLANSCNLMYCNLWIWKRKKTLGLLPVSRTMYTVVYNVHFWAEQLKYILDTCKKAFTWRWIPKYRFDILELIKLFNLVDLPSLLLWLNFNSVFPLHVLCSLYIFLNLKFKLNIGLPRPLLIYNI